MKQNYSNEWLIQQLDLGKQLKFLCFWGHTEQYGAITKACLSQWYPADFHWNHHVFLTAEHWMMWCKAQLFGNRQVAEHILGARTPGEAKKLGRTVDGFDARRWDEAKYEVVVMGSFLKFSQNDRIKDFLLTTEKRVLVEASPVDPIWGIGMDQNHRLIDDPRSWQGSNLLGFALMEARDLLLNQQRPTFQWIQGE